jgi:phosphatidylglycerophosphatase A
MTEFEPEDALSNELLVGWLKTRGVTIDEIALLVLDAQKPYLPDITLAECREAILRVLDKREVQNTIVTGLALDALAEKGLLPEPLGTLLRRDDGLYGVDEMVAISIANIYGSIGVTNFGYLDKVKPGVIERINGCKENSCNTFLDDIVAASAAAAAARIAHNAVCPPQTPQKPA